ncbi:helix-turn-helix domain-containing protein [Streptomyces sulphureus]|uniref:PucR family transcriptional regulator n=1 Tax=Streptomyces sulphureus TaxID=47758 RepID=UPI00036FDD66|nr:PucR family transcriptional regulator [Streptomyces sulphureus]
MARTTTSTGRSAEPAHRALRTAAGTEALDPLPRELATVMWPELPTLLEEMASEIASAVPEYGRLLNSPYGRTLRLGVQRNLATFVTKVADPAASTAERDELCRRLGRDEAHQGRSLQCLQTALRIGARVGLRRAKTLAPRHGMPPSLVVSFADAVFSYVDEIEALCREGYLAAKDGTDEERAAERRRLLRLLLAGDAVPHFTVAELAKRVSWPLPDEVTLVALGSGSRLPTGALEEDVLVEPDDPRPHLLLPGPLDAPRYAALARALDGCRSAVGLTVQLGDASDSLRWARQALSLAESGLLRGEMPVQCEEHLLTLWLLADPPLVEQLARRQLAPLAQLTPAQGDRLVDTLRIWLTTRATATRMAELLHLHPQTIRYRLRTLNRIFRAQLADADQRFATEVALRALHVRGTAGPHSRHGAEEPQHGRAATADSGHRDG